MRITIRQRLMLGFGSVVLLLGVVAYAGITSLQDITVRYDDVVHRVDASAMKAREIEAGVQDEARALASYLLTGEAAYAEEFERASAQVAAALDELSGLATGEAHALADELRTRVQAYEAVSRNLLKRTRYGQAEASFILSEQLRPLREDVVLAAAALKETTDRVVNDQTLLARERANQSVYIVGAVSLAAAVLGVIAALSVSGRVARAVHDVAAVAERVAGGDLSHGEIRAGNNELGDMARSMQRMVEQFRALIGSIQRVASSLMASAQELAASSAQSASGAQNAAEMAARITSGAAALTAAAGDVRQIMAELRQTSHQIAQGAQTTAAEMTRATELLASSARSAAAVAARTGEVSAQTTRTELLAQEGAQVVRESLAAMQRIQAAVTDSAARIRNLEALSAQIGEITAVIGAIADQTNLLALNAAIEAARAGEQGRGFAVVADEVRTLSQRTQKSTEDIEKMIERLQEGVQEAVQSMKDSHKVTNDSVVQSQKVADALNHIVEAVSTIVDMSHQIAQTAEEQSAVARTIDANVSQISTLGQKTAGDAEDTLGASKELAALTDSLRQLVNAFKV